MVSNEKENKKKVQTHHSAGYASADASPPSPVDLGPCGPGGQEADAEYHEADGGHAGADDREDHLHCFDPTEPQMEDLVQHEDAESRAPVHRAAERPHAQATHDRRDQRCVRHARHEVVAEVTCGSGMIIRYSRDCVWSLFWGVLYFFLLSGKF